MAKGSWSLDGKKNLDKEELNGLFVAARKDGLRTHLMVALAYNGAFLVSELIHLRVDSFSFRKGTISFIPLRKAGRRRVRMNGRIRVVSRNLPDPVEYPLPKNVLTAVRKYVDTMGLSSKSFLFPGRTRKSCKLVKFKCPGGHISKREVQGIFDRIAKAAGVKLPGRGIQALKHTRLTEVARKTGDPDIVSEIGHHNSSVMGNHYVRYTNLSEEVNEIGGKV